LSEIDISRFDGCDIVNIDRREAVACQKPVKLSAAFVTLR